MVMPWAGTRCSGASGQSLSGTTMFSQKCVGKDASQSYPHSSALTNIIILT